MNDVFVPESSGTFPGDQFSPTRNEIADLAYEFWKGRGSPLGSPEQDWRQAELQIEHDRLPGSVI